MDLGGKASETGAGHYLKTNEHAKPTNRARIHNQTEANSIPKPNRFLRFDRIERELRLEALSGAKTNPKKTKTKKNKTTFHQSNWVKTNKNLIQGQP